MRREPEGCEGVHPGEGCLLLRLRTAPGGEEAAEEEGWQEVLPFSLSSLQKSGHIHTPLLTYYSAH